MQYFIIFFIEVLILLALSKKVHRLVSTLIYRITGNNKLSVYIMAFLFLPGTIIHELSHFLTGLFLLVPVGELTFIPKIEDESVRLGSVSIAKTDPLRRFLIGSAPLLIGVSLILAIVFFLTNTTDPTAIHFLVGFYLILEIANTMFLSKKDLDGVWKIILIVGLLIALYIVLGIDVDINSDFGFRVNEMFETGTYFMLVPLVVNMLIIAAINVIKKILPV
jgi:hypothetical protein